MERLSIEPLSVMGLPPVESVGLAADLGLQYVALALSALPNPYGYPPFSLRDDLALRRETLAALHDRGVTVSLGDGFVLHPGMDIRDLAGDVAIVAELGAQRINTVTFDPDFGRSVDQFGVLAEMAAEFGLETTLEFSPGLAIADLPTALAAARAVGRPDFRLLIDTMHLVRSGSGPAEVAAVDPDLIGYIQLSDAPLVPTIPDYMEEACFERMVPGAGELPLLEILEALPRHLVIGLEVPLRSQADAGVGPHDRLGRCVDAARKLLVQVDNR
ncbi:MULTISPECIES: sugar phosphate isomerase/epimerase [unclassified Parafrankia]|uniref:sugar phosphate isomerase/epimerase family protein n=1 Tax=unclassified Parafrankia TaxID=2994368 RepID=UPI000DA57128|nr:MULTISPECIES: TIM barrel protein [unclassified Parafrankia]SQD99170.1 Xylose isomerase domain protein TIM barrel [Parafrankia sp. Ea1.12]